jgi:hypothetical protein
MPLDARIDRHKFARLLRAAKAAERDEISASVLRNIVKEIERAGLWEEWAGEEWIQEEVLKFPHEMLEPNTDAHVVTGDEHFSFIARMTLDRLNQGRASSNNTERRFLGEVQYYHTISEKQLDWLVSLAQRVGIDWGPPDKEKSGSLAVRLASRKGK